MEENEQLPQLSSSNDFEITDASLLSGRYRMDRKPGKNEAPGILSEKASGQEGKYGKAQLDDYIKRGLIDKPITRPEWFSGIDLNPITRAANALTPARDSNEEGKNSKLSDGPKLSPNGRPLPIVLGTAGMVSTDDWDTAIADEEEKQLGLVEIVGGLRPTVARDFGHRCHGPNCNVKVKDGRFLCKKHNQPTCPGCDKPLTRRVLCRDCTERKERPELRCIICDRKHQKPTKEVRLCNDCTARYTYDWRTQCGRCLRKFTGRKVERTRPDTCGRCKKQSFGLGVVFEGTRDEAKRAMRGLKKEHPGGTFSVDFNRVTGLHEVRARIEREGTVMAETAAQAIARLKRTAYLETLRRRVEWLDRRIISVGDPARCIHDMREREALTWALEQLDRQS